MGFVKKYKEFVGKYREWIVGIASILVIILGIYNFFYDIPNTHLQVECERYFEINNQLNKQCVINNCGDYFLEDYENYRPSHITWEEP